MKRILIAFLIVVAASLAITQVGGEEKKYKIGVLFWHEADIDYVTFEGIKAGFQTAGIQHEFDIQKAFGEEKKILEIISNWKRQKPDLIYAMGTECCLYVMKEIHDTPIVFTAVTNPVLSGIVPDWKSSGRNLAGNSNWIPTEEILEHFKVAAPQLETLGVIYDPRNHVSSLEVNAAKKVVKKLHLNLVTFELKAPPGSAAGGKSMSEAGAFYNAEKVLPQFLIPASKFLLDKKVDVIWVPIDIVVYKNIDKVRSVVDAAKIPLFASSHRGVKEGAILGIVADYKALGRASVIIALKILTQNTAPKDIPIGTILGRRTYINLKAAREIGFELPLPVLIIADEIIQ